MKIVIDIPREFEAHMNHDDFADSFGRIIYDIRSRIERDETILAGNYEAEVIEMLRDAIRNRVELPEKHGELVDGDEPAARRDPPCWCRL